MEILVTGGMGYIGSHTCVQMLEAGMTPIILDNLSNANEEVLNRIEALTGKRPLFYQGIFVTKNDCAQFLLSTLFNQ